MEKAVAAFTALVVLWERRTHEQLRYRIVNANSVCRVTLMERRGEKDLERELLSRILKNEQEIGQDEERYSRPKGRWCEKALKQGEDCRSLNVDCGKDGPKFFDIPHREVGFMFPCVCVVGGWFCDSLANRIEQG